MRRPSRLGIGLALAVGAAVSLLAGTPPALAASAAPHVSQTNWFWREQQSDLGGSGVAPPAAAPDPTVPAGDLAVAGPTNKQGADKESYVELDLSAIPAGSTLTSFTVTVPLDPHAHQGFAPGRLPKLVACAVGTSWAGGDGAESFSGKPADDCSTRVVGTPAKGGKAYAFSVTSIAQNWLGPDGINTGLALTDDPANKSTAYQVVFGPTNAVTASASWTAPAPATAPPPASTTGSGTTTTTTATSDNTSSGGGAAATGGADLQSQTPPSLPPAAPAPPPQVVTPTPRVVTATPAALPTPSTLPNGMFWVVAAVLAAVVGAAGLVLRDPVVTVPGGVRRGVGRALLRRTAGRPSAVMVPRSSP